MKRRWILYIMVTAILLGVSLHGNAAVPVDADTMAIDIDADYRVLSSSVPPGMIAGDIIIEARLPLEGVDAETLTSIREALPAGADTAIVSDRFHSARWLYITYPVPGPDTIYHAAYGILTALGPISLDAVQLFLNASWEIDTAGSTAEKKDMILSLFDTIDAHTIASMTDTHLVSLSGFSPMLSAHTDAGEKQTNITASLCADRIGAGSTVWLGTPVLTVEY